MDDVGKASAVVADMRKIIRQDPRIIQKLHRRVFFDKLTREQVSLTVPLRAFCTSCAVRPEPVQLCENCVRSVWRFGSFLFFKAHDAHAMMWLQVTIYVSFYVEATNRDAFMAVKQDLLLAFIDCVDRNGAKLAKQRLEVCSVPLLPSWQFTHPRQ